ncbi:MAG TPA: hypothetical protein IAB12_00955 [Candidatus Ornithospirochaeta avicola]|uniref:Uncharacterized protein n=1 Tax=Candidatus Ornithospirochaeta avicola TaxID=2840896 RepID=A0A9D1PT99_9SPIO|nr:hypothetical protein [Candidatus Ornithospirochaeta avicola]
MKKIFLVMTFLLILLFQVTADDSVRLIWNPEIETTGKLWFADSTGIEKSEFPLTLSESENIAEAEFYAHYSIISDSDFTLEFSLENLFSSLSWSADINQSQSPVDAGNSFNLKISNESEDLLKEDSVHIIIKTDSLSNLSSSDYEGVTSSKPTIKVTLKTEGGNA